jgi:Holliday junction resolvase RusA-like endonuclease
MTHTEEINQYQRLKGITSAHLAMIIGCTLNSYYIKKRDKGHMKFTKRDYDKICKFYDVLKLC